MRGLYLAYELDGLMSNFVVNCENNVHYIGEFVIVFAEMASTTAIYLLPYLVVLEYMDIAKVNSEQETKLDWVLIQKSKISSKKTHRQHRSNHHPKSKQ